MGRGERGELRLKRMLRIGKVKLNVGGVIKGRVVKEGIKGLRRYGRKN